ncbi:MAG: MerR family transcriptional regulator [Candidatus Acidiferrum sp.]
MRIGELARKAAVSVQTIRFYERRKLLPDPQRSSSGYRNYDGGDLDNVVFIKWCQQLGFTLKEIRQLLQLHSAVAHSSDSGKLRGSRDLLGIVKMAEEKLATVQEKIKVLQVMERDISSTIRELQRSPAPVCPAAKSSMPRRHQTRKHP